jgi:hypothetical protein
MRLLLLLVALVGLGQAARAEIPDCKRIADPASRLTCYDKINPPIATYPIPLPKPTARPFSVPQTEGTGYVGSPNEDEALVNAKMNGICRGC